MNTLPRVNIEIERVASLHALQILDTPPEERFDRITRLAMRLFNVPIAFISFIDANRQWFKSCFGMDKSDISRDISFCSYAVQQDKTLIIEDTLRDERFANNPFVTGEANIRFYAGQILHSSDGKAVGTLCILDNFPRAFTQADFETLNDLKAIVENELNATELNTALVLQRETEAALQVQREFTNNLLDNSPVATVVIDDQHNVIIWNKAVQKMTGVDSADVLGTDKHKEAFYGEKRPTLGDIIIDSDFESLPNLYNFYKHSHSDLSHSLHSERWFEFEGQNRYVVFDANPIYNSKGNVIAAVTNLQDFTGHKKTEEALRESESRFRNLIECMEIGVILQGPNAEILLCNQASLDLLGLTEDEILGRTSFDPKWKVIHLDRSDFPGNEHPAVQAIKTRQAVRNVTMGVFRPVKQDWVWLLVSAIPQLTSENNVSQVICSFSDITERILAEEALRDSQAQLQDFFDNATDMVQILTASGEFLYVNRAWHETLGYSSEDLKNITVFDLVKPSIRETVIEQFHQTVATAKTTSFEIQFINKNSVAVWVSVNASISYKDGKPDQIRSIMHDITKRKLIERNLIEARETALEASRLKSEFLSSMSHEIRTPMNAIIGLADILWDTPLSVEQRQYVDIFRRAGATLLDLINDILDLSKIEAGHRELESIEFDLDYQIEQIAEVLAVKAHEKGLELACRIAPSTELKLIGDPNRLRQIIVNLIGNAIKFTGSGEVIIQVENDPNNPVPGTLRFSVSDTGIGIPQDRLDSIFNTFSQVDSSTTRKYGGTGLGLAISKRLVEMMNGEIWVESELGKGSTFIFTASFGVQSEKKSSKPSSEVDLKGLRILVVDDNATNRLILRETLLSQGAFVTEAESGEEALSVLDNSRLQQTPFDLVLLDCRMPGLDGFQVAERIRSGPQLSNVTIMMLTSDNRRGDITRTYELGMGGYLVKPIKQNELLSAIGVALSRSNSMHLPNQNLDLPDNKNYNAEIEPVQGDSNTNSISVSTLENSLPGSDSKTFPEVHKKQLRILLVEDSSDNQLLIKVYLSKTQHTLVIADNGEEAVKEFKKGEFDLVLMDMQMPVMDGYTATREIRLWEAENAKVTTPIIALTAFALKEEAQKSLDAGCNSHMTKPIKKATLLAAIEQYASVPNHQTFDFSN